MTYAIGVDLGGTKTAAARVWPDGTIGDVVTAPTPARVGPAAVFDQVAELVRQLDPTDAVGIGVGAAGVVDSRVGRIIYATETFADWVGADIPGQLRSRLDLPPSRPLEVRNDVEYGGMHWLTVGPVGQPDTSLVLTPPAIDPGITSDERRVVEEMMAKGTYAGVNLSTADLDGTFEKLQAGDADVIQEPTDQPWGIRDCALRDPAGNVIRIFEVS